MDAGRQLLRIGRCLPPESLVRQSSPTNAAGAAVNWLRAREPGALHPTSLPGTQGAGLRRERGPLSRFSLGRGMKYWQVCPLGPPAMAIRPINVSPRLPATRTSSISPPSSAPGFSRKADLAPLAALPFRRVDYGAILSPEAGAPGVGLRAIQAPAGPFAVR